MNDYEVIRSHDLVAKTPHDSTDFFVILSRDFEYKTLTALGLFRSWKSLCERVRVLTHFDASLKQFPLEQAYCSHVCV